MYDKDKQSGSGSSRNAYSIIQTDERTMGRQGIETYALARGHCPYTVWDSKF